MMLAISAAPKSKQGHGETDASGVAQADYIYLNDRPIAVLDPSSATLSFLNDDRLGTPQLATDSGQNIAWQNTYVPFGSTGSIGGTITQDLRLPGQVFDPIGGEYLNGFRDYLPLIGRYLEPDPLGRMGSGNNLYAYVSDNPENLVDPLGLCPKNPGKSNQRKCGGIIAEGAVQTGLDALERRN